MPDQDRVERALHPRWRRAYRLIKGKNPLELIDAALATALADHLRAEGGIPAFGEFINLVNTQVRAESLGEAVRSIEKRFAYSRTVMAAGQGVLKLAAKVAAGTALPGAFSVAEECCWQVLDNCLLGKLDRLVGAKRPFESVSELTSYAAQLRRSITPTIRQFAERLAQEPAAVGMRAPRSPREKHSTRELVDMPVFTQDR